MENLAACLWVPIITSLHPPVTRKGGLQHHAWISLVVEVVAPACSTDSLSFQSFSGVSHLAALVEVEPEDEHLDDDLHQHHLANHQLICYFLFKVKLQFIPLSIDYYEIRYSDKDEHLDDDVHQDHLAIHQPNDDKYFEKILQFIPLSINYCKIRYSDDNQTVMVYQSVKHSNSSHIYFHFWCYDHMLQ